MFGGFISIAGLLEEAGGLHGNQLVDKVLKKRRRREKLGEVMFLKPPGCSSRGGSMEIRLPRGWLPAAPCLSPVMLNHSQLSPRKDTHGKPLFPPGSSVAEMKEEQDRLEARVRIGFSGSGVYRCSLSPLGICPMQGTLWSEKG